MKNNIRYELNFDLPNGINLRIVEFNHRRHQWNFSHHFLQEAHYRPGGYGGERIENKLKAEVNYVWGVVDNLALRMDVCQSMKRGRTFLGEDISGEGVYSLRFDYEKSDGGLLIRKVQIGKAPAIELDTLRSPVESEEGLIESQNLIFPVHEKLMPENGFYSILIMVGISAEEEIRFPVSYQKKK